MKRIVIIAGALISLLLVVWVVPLKQKEERLVKADFSRVLSAAGDVRMWQSIDPSFRTVDDRLQVAERFGGQDYPLEGKGTEISVAKVNPLVFLIAQHGNAGHAYCTVAFKPTSGAAASKLILLQRTNLWQWLLRMPLSGTKILDGLDVYLSNDANFYGYNFKHEVVIDSVVATKVIRIGKQQLLQQIPLLDKEIRSYASHRGLTAKNYTNIALGTVGYDSLELSVGVAVNKQAVSAGGISCRMMPFKGRLLSTEYNGAFNQRSAVYQAMERYLHDKQIEMIALPFEQYLPAGFPVADTAFVHMILYTPVL